LDEEGGIEIPEWLTKAIVSLEQKIGKIKNEISTNDKKKKKKGNSNNIEELNIQLHELNKHMAKWKEIEIMARNTDFLLAHIDDFDCFKDSLLL